MYDIDLNLLKQDVNPADFEPIDYNQIPKLFLGFIIKNAFEYEILQCNDHVQDIAHLCGSNCQIEPVFLRGIFIEPSNAVELVIEKLNKIQSLDVNDIFARYIKILNQFNLSCNSTYGYLMDGIYPIDVVHLQTISKDNISYTKYASNILDEEKNSWYFKPELKILILTKSNTYISKNI
jgi:hypothetical protein